MSSDLTLISLAIPARREVAGHHAARPIIGAALTKIMGPGNAPIASPKPSQAEKEDGERHYQHHAHVDGIGRAARGRRGHRATAARVLPPMVPTSPNRKMNGPARRSDGHAAVRVRCPTRKRRPVDILDRSGACDRQRDEGDDGRTNSNSPDEGARCFRPASCRADRPDVVPVVSTCGCCFLMSENVGPARTRRALVGGAQS